MAADLQHFLCAPQTQYLLRQIGFWDAGTVRGDLLRLALAFGDLLQQQFGEAPAEEGPNHEWQTILNAAWQEFRGLALAHMPGAQRRAPTFCVAVDKRGWGIWVEAPAFAPELRSIKPKGINLRKLEEAATFLPRRKRK